MKKNIFFTLLKNDCLNLFSLTKINKKKNKVTRKGAWGIILFIVLMYLGLTYYSFMFTDMGLQAGVNELGLYFGVSMGTLMCLIFTFTNAHSVLFKSKDYDLLMSLPIEEYKIVSSKLVSISLIGYLYFSFAYLPSLMFYLLLIDFNIIVLIFGLLVFLINPMLVLSISSFISLLFARLTSKMKNKNIVSSLLYLGFFALILSFSLRLGFFNGSGEVKMYEFTLSMQEKMKNVYPLSNYCVGAIFGNIVDLLIVFAICVVPFIIFIVLSSKFYVRLNSLGSSGYKNKNFKLKDGKTTTPLGALLKKEFKTFVSTPIYLANYMATPIFGCISLIGMSILLSTKVITINEVPLTGWMKSLLVLIVASFFFGLAPMTSVSINIEGKNFWLIKALPVSEKEILFSKVFFSLLVNGSFMLVSLLASIVILDVSVFESLIILITPFVYLITFSFIGMLLNIKFYNLEWTNPTQAVKQGAGLMLSMLIDMGISSQLLTIVIVSLFFEIDLSIVPLILGIVLLIIFGRLLFTKGVKGFSRISV